MATNTNKRNSKAPARKAPARKAPARKAPAPAPAPAAPTVAQLQQQLAQHTSQAKVHREQASLHALAAQATKAALREAAPQAGRGRPSIYAGRRIVATCRENPRQQGTAGWHSMAFVLAGGKRGVAWEALAAHMLALGAATPPVKNTSPGQHVAWDLKHGNVVLR